MQEQELAIENTLMLDLDPVINYSNDKIEELIWVSGMTRTEFINGFKNLELVEKQVIIDQLSEKEYLSEVSDILKNFNNHEDIQEEVLTYSFNTIKKIELLHGDKTVALKDQVITLISLLVCKSNKIAILAADKLKNLEISNNQLLKDSIKTICSNKAKINNWTSKHPQILNLATATVEAYHYYPTGEDKEKISESDLEKIISPDATLYSIEDQPFSKFFIMKTKIPDDMWLDAAWVSIDNKYQIFIVSSELNNDDLVDRIKHELMVHKCDDLLTQIQFNSNTASIDYAVAQQKVDPGLKKLASRWAVRHFELSNGAGIVFDAGSSCLFAWEEVARAIKKGDVAYLTVYTNSLLILEEWREEVAVPQIREIKMKLIGWELDCGHRAFYGGKEEALERLSATSFRPWVVFIGTNGIEFDENHGILFGYHADNAERDMKHLFFQCYARQRVILATPDKIGYTGGLLFNVLDIPDLDNQAPIYLVTTKPEKEEHRKRFNNALEIYKSEKFQTLIDEKGLEFHWIILDEKGRFDQDIVAPGKSITKKSKS